MAKASDDLERAVYDFIYDFNNLEYSTTILRNRGEELENEILELTNELIDANVRILELEKG